jgi:hypothetical protein
LTPDFAAGVIAKRKMANGLFAQATSPNGRFSDGKVFVGGDGGLRFNLTYNLVNASDVFAVTKNDIGFTAQKSGVGVSDPLVTPVTVSDTSTTEVLPTTGTPIYRRTIVVVFTVQPDYGPPYFFGTSVSGGNVINAVTSGNTQRVTLRQTIGSYTITLTGAVTNQSAIAYPIGGKSRTTITCSVLITDTTSEAVIYTGSICDLTFGVLDLSVPPLVMTSGPDMPSADWVTGGFLGPQQSGWSPVTEFSVYSVEQIVPLQFGGSLEVSSTSVLRYLLIITDAFVVLLEVYTDRSNYLVVYSDGTTKSLPALIGSGINITRASRFQWRDLLTLYPMYAVSIKDYTAVYVSSGLETWQTNSGTLHDRRTNILLVPAVDSLLPLQLVYIDNTTQGVGCYNVS